MRTLAFYLVLLLGASYGASGAEIKPVKPPARDTLIRLDVTPSEGFKAQAYAWTVLGPEGLVEKEISQAGKRCCLAAGPGRYTAMVILTAVRMEDGQPFLTQEQADYQFIIPGTPVIPPGPDPVPPGPTPIPPGPTPPPGPPVTTVKLDIVVIHESEEMNPDRKILLNSIQSGVNFSDYRKGRGHSLYLLDDDSQNPDGTPALSEWQPVISGLTMPVLILVNKETRKLVYKQTLTDTMTAADVLKLVQDYDG